MRGFDGHSYHRHRRQNELWTPAHEEPRKAGGNGWGSSGRKKSISFECLAAGDPISYLAFMGASISEKALSINRLALVQGLPFSGNHPVVKLNLHGIDVCAKPKWTYISISVVVDLHAITEFLCR